MRKTPDLRTGDVDERLQELSREEQQRLLFALQNRLAADETERRRQAARGIVIEVREGSVTVESPGREKTVLKARSEAAFDPIPARIPENASGPASLLWIEVVASEDSEIRIQAASLLRWGARWGSPVALLRNSGKGFFEPLDAPSKRITLGKGESVSIAAAGFGRRIRVPELFAEPAAVKPDLKREGEEEESAR